MIKKVLHILLIILLLITLLTSCQVNGDNAINKNLDKLNKSNPYLRRQAIASLASTGKKEVILPIVKMLNDSDKDVVKQVHIELNNLREYGLQVDKVILLGYESLGSQYKSSVLNYIIEGLRSGLPIDKVFIENLSNINDIEQYRDLLIYLNTRSNTDFYVKLLAMLPTKNGGIASEALLLLDKYGYSPSKALIDELINQGFELSEATGQMIIKFICRDSLNNTSNNKLQINYTNSGIEVVDNSEQNQKRCESGDMMYDLVPNGLTYITKLALLSNVENTNEDLKILLNKYITNDQSKVIETIMRDKEDYPKSHEVSLALISILANNEIINDKLNNDLGNEDVISVTLSEEEENELSKELFAKKGLLIVNSENNKVIGNYHWYIPKEYRPSNKEDVRYVLSILENNQYSLVDLANRELLYDNKIDNLTDIYSIIDQFIQSINEN